MNKQTIRTTEHKHKQERLQVNMIYIHLQCPKPTKITDQLNIQYQTKYFAQMLHMSVSYIQGTSSLNYPRTRKKN